MASERNKSGYVDNWQNGKTLPECNLHMLLTEDFCDVSFRVGLDGHVIRAHRYVLVSRSCVFHAMFCGPMAEQGEITIPDIEADVFKDFLRFLYTDKAVLTAENAPGLLYTSRKYDVDALFSQCEFFLEHSLTETNVCEILEHCHVYREVDIEEKARKMLRKSGEITLKSKGFKKICPPCFESYLTSNDLRVKEEDVFEATLSWAKERCDEENIEPSPKNQRKVLGSLIYQIRFPLFSLEYLTTTVRESGILTPDERKVLVDKKNDPDIDIAPFSSNQRREKYICKTKHYVSRFRSEWAASSGYVAGGYLDSVSFKTNRDIMLVGCQIYGDVKPKERNFQVSITLYNDQHTIISEPYKSAFFSLKGGRELSNILFSEPVDIMGKHEYTISITLQGTNWSPTCNWGGHGVKSITVKGVTFTFMTSTLPGTDSRTNVDRGQIPGLIWSP